MSTVLAVLACAALFVTFGLLHRRGAPRIGCHVCGGGKCVPDCPWKSPDRETNDATR